MARAAPPRIAALPAPVLHENHVLPVHAVRRSHDDAGKDVAAENVLVLKGARAPDLVLGLVLVDGAPSEDENVVRRRDYLCDLHARFARVAGPELGVSPGLCRAEATVPPRLPAGHLLVVRRPPGFLPDFLFPPVQWIRLRVKPPWAVAPQDVQNVVLTLLAPVV